jgi:hypothetical protein
VGPRRLRPGKASNQTRESEVEEGSDCARARDGSLAECPRLLLGRETRQKWVTAAEWSHVRRLGGESESEVLASRTGDDAA